MIVDGKDPLQMLNLTQRRQPLFSIHPTPGAPGLGYPDGSVDAEEGILPDSSNFRALHKVLWSCVLHDARGDAAHPCADFSQGIGPQLPLARVVL